MRWSQITLIVDEGNFAELRAGFLIAVCKAVVLASCHTSNRPCLGFSTNVICSGSVFLYSCFPGTSILHLILSISLALSWTRWFNVEGTAISLC